MRALVVAARRASFAPHSLTATSAYSTSPGPWFAPLPVRRRRQGLITADEERMLNRLFDFNPLLFDLSAAHWHSNATASHCGSWHSASVWAPAELRLTGRQ